MPEVICLFDLVIEDMKIVSQMLLLVARFSHRMGMFQSNQCMNLRGRVWDFEKLPPMEFMMMMEKLGVAISITKSMCFRA